VLTTLGIGEAMVTVLTPSGAPSPPFVCRVLPPSSRMGPLTPAEMQQRLAASEQVREYAQAVDRESARELLAKRMTPAAAAQPPAAAAPAERAPARAGKEPPSTFEQILRSPMARSVATTVTRGLLGALLGSPPRRRRRSY